MAEGGRVAKGEAVNKEFVWPKRLPGDGREVVMAFERAGFVPVEWFVSVRAGII
jgi:hypothetical protein